MSDLVELHRRGAASFGAYVEQIASDQWARPTPCTDWDVRSLVNHLVYEAEWTVPLFNGATVEEVGDQFEGDRLGDDPVAAWHRTIRPALNAVAAPDALTRTVHLSWTDAPGSEYLTQLVIDLGVHGWDLARAIGADDTIDPDLVAVANEWVDQNADLVAGSGVFGEPIDAPADASPQAKLLAKLGRRA